MRSIKHFDILNLFLVSYASINTKNEVFSSHGKMYYEMLTISWGVLGTFSSISPALYSGLSKSSGCNENKGTKIVKTLLKNKYMQNIQDTYFVTMCRFSISSEVSSSSSKTISITSSVHFNTSIVYYTSSLLSSELSPLQITKTKTNV